MDEAQSQLIDLDDAFGPRRLAAIIRDGATPGVVWMQGLKSDMVSTKAAALADWAETNDVALLRFDYSGHGQSGGDFAACTVSQWLADSIAAFQRTTGDQVVVGSSMGGGLAMLLRTALQAAAPADADRIKGLVLIAPAWDMTEALMWAAFPDDVKETIQRDGVWLRPSQYGDPYPISRALIEDGRKHLLGDRAWTPGCPVTIIHGRLDPDVPFAHSERLIAQSPNADIALIEVPDGEHRLSRPEDIALLIDTIERMRSAVASS